MNINSETILFAVLGDPVSHSLEPLMHNTAFSELGYNGAYLAFRVKDIGKAVVGIKAPVEVMKNAVLNALGKE
jgi:shikimate dehydrogenase